MEILIITFITFCAAFIGTLAGFGLATIMVPVLLLFLPLGSTLLLVGILHFLGDLSRIAFFYRHLSWHLIALFGIPGILFSLLGARLVVSVNDEILTRFIGALLLIYGVLFIRAPQARFKPRTSVAILGGAVSGFLSGISGVGGAIRAALLSAFDLPRTSLITTLAAIGVIVDVGRIGSYLASGITLDPALGAGMLFFIPASFIGTWWAKITMDKIPERTFQIIIAALLFLTGVKMIITP